MMRIRRFFEVLVDPKQIAEGLEWRTRALRRGLDMATRGLIRRVFGLPTVQLDAVAGPLPDGFAPIQERSCMPPHAGSSGHDDMIPLLRIVRKINPRCVLELGTAHGNTVANICRVCEAHVYTVNALPEQLSGDLTTFALSKDDIGIVYRKYGYEGRVTQVYANTLKLDLTQHVPAGSIDLAIIDACHDSEYVLNDFRAILPVLNKKAVVLFHDTHPSMEAHLIGSYRACAWLRLQGYPIVHIEGTWWGLWNKHTRG
jgi:predicted O-methyltransferase YrrM